MASTEPTRDFFSLRRGQRIGPPPSERWSDATFGDDNSKNRGCVVAKCTTSFAERLSTLPARLALIQQAEQSVDDKLDALKSDARALRQSEITTELLDVIIGYEALKNDRRSGRDNSEG